MYYMGVWVLMMFIFDYVCFGKLEDVMYYGCFNFGMFFYLVIILFNGVVGIYLVSSIL